MRCFCVETYKARLADIARGWAKTCSKRCAAIKREFGRPNGMPVNPSDKIKYGNKPNYKKRHKHNTEKRYVAERVQRAKDNGFYPFDSENEMYEAMCDDPIEGR